MNTHINQLSPGEIDHARQIINKSGRPYLGLSDSDLLDEINHQKIVVDECVNFAQRVASELKRESTESLSGLYFAILRYQQLADELEKRFDEDVRLREAGRC